MTQVLYRKYRPLTFEEVEGQEHVVRTLEGAILSGHIGHAYLFTGPRGTGKTTMARLFAKALNCANKKGHDPCNNCHTCNEINGNRFIDLIEIDAASNRGIDEIRNIQESARVASSHGSWKIFIIDEVHMLTPQAFNALLKVLEEPPSHVVFMLATTEPHKVIDTILSRVQRFDFKKLNVNQIETKLSRIARKEKISIDKDSVTAIAMASAGSLRDAENSLAKVMAYTEGEVTIKDTSEILGIVPEDVNRKMLSALEGGNANEAILTISEISESGHDLDNFTGHFLSFLRARLLNSFDPSKEPGAQTPEFLARTIKAFIKARSELRLSPLPQLPLELAVIEIANQQKQ
ncbi:MAG: DNA polymerase III subunit gamma/tau [bacterium]|nr:DNA polymerase III subunit gamma/tau [bacterium]